MARAQLKIQQMAFMLVALFIFFLLAGIFFLQINFGQLKKRAYELKKQEIFSLLEVVANLPELRCGEGRSYCVDEYKVMAWDKSYEEFLPIGSLKIFKIFPKNQKPIKCPAPHCNYYELINKNQSAQEYGAYITLCRTEKKLNNVYEKCEIAKLVIGLK